MLSNYCLSLLSRVYGQRKEIMENLSNIIVVSRGNMEDLSRRSVDTRGKLLVLASYNVLNIKPKDKEFYKLWDDPNYEEKDTDEITGVIQELAYLTISMKRNIVLTNSAAMSLYKYESLYPFHEFKDREAEMPPGEKTYPIITEKGREQLPPPEPDQVTGPPPYPVLVHQDHEVEA